MITLFRTYVHKRQPWRTMIPVEYRQDAGVDFVRYKDDGGGTTFERVEMMLDQWELRPGPNSQKELKSITLLDPDGDHVEIYVDGKRADADNGMSSTARFLDWLKANGIKLPFEIEYRHVDESVGDTDWWPPETLDEMKEREG